MGRRRNRRKQRSGQAPGSTVYVGEVQGGAVGLTLMRYGHDEVIEAVAPGAAELDACARPDQVSWLNLDGVHEAERVVDLGRRFGLHPLVVEDLLNPASRPKAEEYEGQLFLVAKQLHVTATREAEVQRLDVQVEQVGLILGQGYLLTFQERPGDAFDPVRERVRHGRGRIRRSGPDYLAYALLDALVDRYFEVLDTLAEEVEALEQEVLLGQPAALPRRVHLVREDLRLITKVLGPLQEAIASLQRGGGGLVASDTQPFLRDLGDHVRQVQDHVDSLSDALIALLDTHLALAGQRLNEVNQVLTVVATVFLPLTFIAGVYGMNFQHMPELAWRWGYPMSLGLMLAVALGLLAFFKRRGWF